MKKSIKIISLFIVALVAIFVSKDLVFAADSAPSTFKSSTHKLQNNPLGLTQTINVKQTTNGKYVYCLDVNKKLPDSSITYTKNTLINDRIISNIIASGYNDKTDTEFFATQAALWIYLYDTKQMSDTSYNYIQKIKTAVYSTKYANDPVALDIKNILVNAINSTKASNEKSVLEITTNKVEFNLKNGEYVSNTIKVNTDIENNDYNVNLYNSPKTAKVTKTSNGFKITIPEEDVKVGTTTFKAIVSSSDTIYNVYKYTASNSNYQNMLAVYPETLPISDEISVSITKEEEPTVIVISKQDITTEKELPGATLIVRDSNGKIVDKWVSKNKPHTLDDLEPGKYTLEEKISPEGYVLSSEKISFTVREDGKVKTVIMYNSPEEVKELVVSISKQDITTKEELPGATLIIRDSEGKELYRWVSSDKPYIIKGIEEGTYTLEEIIAPEGYTLSSEKITFEVKDNGVVTEVVMFNAPEATEIIVVPPTGINASTIGYILGGLVIIIGSVLIYKNVKKEQ